MMPNRNHDEVEFVAPAGDHRIEHDSRALERISGAFVHKLEPRNVLLAKLERASDDAELFEAELVPDWTHPFFFEHLLDHIPSMMLVEAGRQTAIAICHRFFDVPFGAVFITRSYDIRFTDFGEVSVDDPVRIRAKVRDRQVRRGRLVALRVEGEFVQAGRSLGQMEGGLTVFTRETYVRLRRMHDRKRRSV
jgi:hypothetical protein